MRHACGVPPLSFFHDRMLTAVVSIIYYLVLLAWSLAYFIFMLVLFAVTAPFDSERRALHGASRLWARSMFRLNPLWRVRVEGAGNIVRGQAYVVTVNHQSMVDIPLMYFLPWLNFKWVAKRSVYRWPLFGVVLWLHGDITVDTGGSVRRTLDFMKEGLERLSRGTSVVIFPEGTRSRDGEVHNFKEGAFMLAKEAGVAILPCILDGTREFMKGWRVCRTVFTVRIMAPISAEEVAARPAREILTEVRELTVAELASIRGRSQDAGR